MSLFLKFSCFHIWYSYHQYGCLIFIVVVFRMNDKCKHKEFSINKNHNTTKTYLACPAPLGFKHGVVKYGLKGILIRAQSKAPRTPGNPYFALNSWLIYQKIQMICFKEKIFYYILILPTLYWQHPKGQNHSTVGGIPERTMW